MDESSCELPTFAISMMLSLDCPAPMILEFLVCSNLWIFHSISARVSSRTETERAGNALMGGWETKSRSTKYR